MEVLSLLQAPGLGVGMKYNRFLGHVFLFRCKAHVLRAPVVRRFLMLGAYSELP